MTAHKLGPDRDRMAAAMVAVSRLRMHPRNIRRVITGVDELAASIRHEGVIEPLIAHQKHRRGPRVQDLELIAGHRRLAAAEIAGLTRVPVIILPTHEDDEAMLAMLAENTARVAVPAADLGRAVTELHAEFGYSYPAIAERLGISLDELTAWRRGTPLRDARPKPPAAKPRKPRKPSPKIRPTQVHELCRRWDAGEVDADALVDEVRSWLGDWEPVDKPAPINPPTEEADWAEVEQLLAGKRLPKQTTAAACMAAVQQLTEQGLSAEQIGGRIGMSSRHVQRYRALVSEVAS